uniref:Chromatin associated protein kti12 n=1 Tax=Angiostrongylus cantonensis TaxID=6313 RepID=A0A0K0DM33_ANGCA
MGLPAAGKSTLSRKLEEAHPNSVVFSLDEVNGRWSDDFDAHRSRKFFEQTVRLYLQNNCDEEFNKVVIVDDNFYLQSMRRPFERMAAYFGLRYCCIVVASNVEDALHRNSRRGTDRVSDEAILKMAREMDIPKDAFVYNCGHIEEILQRLIEPCPHPRMPKQRIHSHSRCSSVLAKIDCELRAAVAEAVRQGLDGRQLAVAKRTVLSNCRMMKCSLSVEEIHRGLLDEYYHTKH